MAGKKKEDLQGNIGAAFGDYHPGFTMSGIYTSAPAEPVPEEPKQQPKEEAPKADDQKKPDPDPEGEPEKRGRRIKKVALEEKYSRQTYWLRKEYIQKVQDYAFTEDINLRQAINRLLSIAFEEIDKQYQEEGKKLLHYDERKDYEYDYL